MIFPSGGSRVERGNDKPGRVFKKTRSVTLGTFTRVANAVGRQLQMERV
jgi:hypothetical protein